MIARATNRDAAARRKTHKSALAAAASGSGIARKNPKL